MANKIIVGKYHELGKLLPITATIDITTNWKNEPIWWCRAQCIDFIYTHFQTCNWNWLPAAYLELNPSVKKNLSGSAPHGWLSDNLNLYMLNITNTVV